MWNVPVERNFTASHFQSLSDLAKLSDLLYHTDSIEQHCYCVYLTHIILFRLQKISKPTQNIPINSNYTIKSVEIGSL